MIPNSQAGTAIAPFSEREHNFSTTGDSCLIDASHPQRRQVESFIAQRFLDVHGARIANFMPNLLALSGADGRTRAALGVRDAACGSLFLEYYLDSPVENVLAEKAALCRLPARARIAEIGNLASVDRRASRRLFSLLSAYLARENFEWAVFTGCSALTRMFAGLGIETVTLGRALQSSLPVDQQTWGGYYEDSPQVVAGRVSRGLDAFVARAAVADGAPS